MENTVGKRFPTVGKHFPTVFSTLLTVLMNLQYLVLGRALPSVLLTFIKKFTFFDRVLPEARFEPGTYRIRVFRLTD